MPKPISPPKFASVPLLTDEAVRRLIDIDAAIETIERAYEDYGRERRVLSVPPAMLLPHADETRAAFKIKGARLRSLGVSGFRMIADRIINDAEESIDFCWVADETTGRVIGLVDETWLHRLRTALTGVVAAKWLARADSRVVAIIGAGKIADELPLPLSRAFDLQEIRIASRRIQSAEAFAQRHANVSTIRTFDDIDRALDGADVVICISSASRAVLHARAIAPGMTICGMGGGPEIAADVLDRADRFVIDDLDYALTIGSVKGWIAEGRSRDMIVERTDADLGEIALGAKRGRTDNSEVVLAIVQGMACCDVALASLVLSRAGIAPPQPNT